MFERLSKIDFWFYGKICRSSNKLFLFEVFIGQDGTTVTAVQVIWPVRYQNKSSTVLPIFSTVLVLVPKCLVFMAITTCLNYFCRKSSPETTTRRNCPNGSSATSPFIQGRGTTSSVARDAKVCRKSAHNATKLGHFEGNSRKCPFIINPHWVQWG